MILTESRAIVDYLERVQPSPALFGGPTPERISELVSFASTHLFSKLEFGVVKVRLAAEADRTSEAELAKALVPGLAALKPVLAALEALLERGGSGPYAIGSSLSAADLFMYPPIADLKAMPEGKILEHYIRLNAWTTFFTEHDLSMATREGAIEGGGRPWL